MPALLIFGDPGMGKTKIIEKFLREHFRRRICRKTGTRSSNASC